MRKILIAFLLFFPILLTFQSCCKKRMPQQTTTSVSQEQANPAETGVAAVPHVIIYKTRADYFNYVPVILNEDKSKIMSYPDVKDVFINGDLAYPTLLNGGWLLDNRGINRFVAFTNFTYGDYGRLPQTPTPEELMQNLLDRDPIIEMYDCGSKYQFKDLINELNAKIDAGDFTNFQKIK